MDYVIAIPSYNRTHEITIKTLKSLKEGGIPSNKIHVFVANQEEEKKYRETLDKTSYEKIVLGIKGIVQQRIFISNYFPEGKYIVSLDDDVEGVFEFTGNKRTLLKIINLDSFFKQAFERLEKENLYIWGVYPVYNPYFMYDKVTTDLRFLIGVLYGYINRHNQKLYPTLDSVSKDDYHHTILYYLNDGGVVRFNNITAKTKFDAPGGLGNTGRFEKSENAAEFLAKTYPEIVKRKRRKSGEAETSLNRFYTNN